MTAPDTDRCVLCFDDEAGMARRLAGALGCAAHVVERHRFPDGEVRLRLPPQLPRRAVLLRGLQQPNEKLIELLLAAAGARELGATELILVAPYLAYMRQDMAFTPGEVVSQRHLGALLAQAFEGIVTVDPHLHRVHSLDEVVPGRRGVAVSVAGLLGAWIASHQPDALLIGPDEEAEQWVAEAARPGALDWAVGRKVRHGDRDVQVSLPDASPRGRAVVLIDDVASTGHTLIDAAQRVLAAGAVTVDVAVTHALFVGDALARLHAAGVRHVWSADTVAHPTNAVSVVPLLVAALQAA